MPNPFKHLKDPTEVEVQEWGGQYDCLEITDGTRCMGYARVAKYIPSERILTWRCQFDHTSVLEEVDDD